MRIHEPHVRKVASLDVAAHLISRALPRRARHRVDQLRLDFRALASGLRRPRPRAASDAVRGVWVSPPLDAVDPLALLPRRVAEGIRSTRRDVSMLVNGLVRGRHPSPVVKRRAGKHAAAAPRSEASPAPGRSTRPLVVTRVVRETPDAVSIHLREADGRPLRHLPGQFLSLDVRVGGETLRRAYSLASPALDGADPHVTVKRMPDGRVSGHLNEALRPGDLLQVLGPSGSFVVEPDPGAARHLVLVAGGSGITPCMSILHTLLVREPDSRVTLLYGNRRVQDVIFADRLDDLAARHPDRLRIDHILEEVDETRAATCGRLDAETLRARLESLDVRDSDVSGYYVCGPAPVLDAAQAALEARGVAAERIHEERFTRPGEHRDAEGSPRPEILTLRSGGESHRLVVKPGQTLLEAVQAEGAELPFSCAMGGCGACRMRCTSGAVVMAEPNCLTPADREAGLVLTCVGRPLGPVTLESLR